jgi:hypothetical protein
MRLLGCSRCVSRTRLLKWDDVYAFVSVEGGLAVGAWSSLGAFGGRVEAETEL